MCCLVDDICVSLPRGVGIVGESGVASCGLGYFNEPDINTPCIDAAKKKVYRVWKGFIQSVHNAAAS